MKQSKSKVKGIIEAKKRNSNLIHGTDANADRRYQKASEKGVVEIEKMLKGKSPEERMKFIDKEIQMLDNDNKLGIHTQQWKRVS